MDLTRAIEVMVEFYDDEVGMMLDPDEVVDHVVDHLDLFEYGADAPVHEAYELITNASDEELGEAIDVVAS
jgi:hypothetical protein